MRKSVQQASTVENGRCLSLKCSPEAQGKQTLLWETLLWETLPWAGRQQTQQVAQCLRKQKRPKHTSTGSQGQC